MTFETEFIVTPSNFIVYGEDPDAPRVTLLVRVELSDIAPIT